MANSKKSKESRKNEVSVAKRGRAKEPAQGAAAILKNVTRVKQQARAAPDAGGSSSPGKPARLVVGVGASAGGLAAVGELLAHLSCGADICLILVLHLAPTKKSLMAELFSRASGLSVSQAHGGEPVEGGRVYVIPPGHLIEVQEDRIKLLPRPAESPPHPVDHLLRSLAKCYGSKAVGVVLSGTGNDGTEGLREIGECGGMTFVQEPDTAQHDGMPRAAVRAGVARVVLPTEQIARQLASKNWGKAPVEEDLPVHEIDAVFDILRKAVGVDFSQYKTPTLRRRLQRRMNMRGKGRLQDYLVVLETEPDEARRLGEDLLVQVTRFFREPESFAAMATEALPNILQNKSSEEPVRVWVPGCATGEDVYSIAIVVLELIQHKPHHRLLQIFGTDVSEMAIHCARVGVYPLSIERDVSPDRLRRFFMRTENGYRISPGTSNWEIWMSTSAR